MFYIGDIHVTIYFFVNSVIYAYIVEVHLIITFNILSYFLGRKVILSGIRKYYDGLNCSGFSAP